MRLKSILIENFRQFETPQKVEFAFDERKNVTLISGANGTGKTAFCNALLWCLYGSSYRFLDECYDRSLILPAWKRETLSEGESASTSVAMDLELLGWSARVERSKRFTIPNAGYLPVFLGSESFHVQMNLGEESEDLGTGLSVFAEKIPGSASVGELIQSQSIGANGLAGWRLRRLGRRSRLPVLLDSPFSLIDLAEQDRLAKQIPELRRQVVLLVSPGTFTDELVEKIESRIGAKYEIRQVRRSIAAVEPQIQLGSEIVRIK